jgi:hypothetical protein
MWIGVDPGSSKLTKLTAFFNSEWIFSRFGLGPFDMFLFNL